MIKWMIVVWASLIVSLMTVRAEAAVVLQYHHISDSTPAATSITPERFRAHMNYLAERVAGHGFRVLPLSELVDSLRQGKPLPDNAVAITFDDGYRSVYTEAFPLLRARGWPFTVFVNTGPLQQRLAQFVSWDELREMAAAGATIANHSHTHPHLLRQLDGESESAWSARIGAELEQTQALIDRALGEKGPRILAYPYGEYNQRLKALLRELGYAGFGQQSGPLPSQLRAEGDLQALPRFPFGGVYGDVADFVVKVSSLPLPVKGVTLTDEQGVFLQDLVLPADVVRPRLNLALSDSRLGERVNCFASGQGAIAVEPTSDGVTAQANTPLGAGRSRYNCTAPSQQTGRFYWFSQLFIRKRADGSWYSE